MTGMVTGRVEAKAAPPSRSLETAIAIGVWRRPFRHVHGLWGRFWIVPLLPAVYSAILFFTGDLRWEHIAVSVIVAVLAFATRTTKAFFVLACPILLIGWGEDAIRYLIPVFVTPDRILGCSMRSAELAFFAVGPNQTLSDYFAVHHAPLFDVLAAVPYAIFWMIPVAYAGWLFYADRSRLSFYLWSLFLAHTVVWMMWLIFPAAPPWYIQSHGCVIDASAPSSAAALLRVDELFGLHYFQGFYSRSMTTFGALPSGHCVFPMIGLLTAWHSTTWRTRPFHLIYAASMLAASVYLEHHWLLDGLLAWVISAAAAFTVGALLRGRARRPSSS
jgi:inositol phosphorylceramide synthase catalytic subunit